MKHIKKALVLALGLCTLPVVAAPGTGTPKTINKLTYGTLSVSSLYLAMKVLPPTYNFSKFYLYAIVVDKKMPPFCYTTSLGLATGTIAGGIYGTYYFGKKLYQQFN